MTSIADYTWIEPSTKIEIRLYREEGNHGWSFTFFPNNYAQYLSRFNGVRVGSALTVPERLEIHNDNTSLERAKELCEICARRLVLGVKLS